MRLPPITVPERVRRLPTAARRAARQLPGMFEWAALRVLRAITMRRAVRALVIGVVGGGMLFLFVLPARTWLAQGRAMSQAQHRISVLSQENQELTTKAAQLQTPAYIEQIARSEYGLIKPGEQSYGIVLAPVTTTTVPPAPSKPGRK